ncbi:MAG: hypothetical protein E7263_05020 [Lachnospiraceae bacterium]|nr:hypothetical protein [Lachnospiraceae bacterium]
MENKSLIFLVIGAIFFPILIVACFVTDKEFLFAKEPTDIFQLIEEEGEPTKNAYVSIDVDASLDWYAETKHTTNGIPTGKEKHYLIWLDDTSFISLTTSGKKNYEKLSDITTTTFEYLNGVAMYLPEPVKFEGQVKTMNSEIREYYEDALYDWGITVEDGMTIYYVTIDSTSTPMKEWAGIIVMTIVEIIIIIFIAREVKSYKMMKAQAAAAKATALLYDNSDPVTDENNNLYS